MPLSFSLYSGTREVLSGMSLLPWAKACVTRKPANLAASAGFFGPLLKTVVKATTCEVSRPMMPIFFGVSSANTDVTKATAQAARRKRRGELMPIDNSRRGD